LLLRLTIIIYESIDVLQIFLLYLSRRIEIDIFIFRFIKLPGHSMVNAASLFFNRWFDYLSVHQVLESPSHFLHLALLLLRLLLLLVNYCLLGLNFINQDRDKVLELQVLLRLFLKFLVEFRLKHFKIIIRVVGLHVDLFV
jgi:hypothetical protein